MFSADQRNRAENPLGDWTIRVSDQNHPEEHNGTFLGWNMIFFGSVIDESKVKEWEIPEYDFLLPPGKPDDLEDAPEDQDNQQEAPEEPTPTDSTVPEPSSDTPNTESPPFTPSPSSSALPSGGIFSSMSDVAKNHPYISMLMLAIVGLSVGVGVWVWRRRTQANRPSLEEYVSLPPEAEGLPMTTVGGASQSRLSLDRPFRDEDDADENTRLHQDPAQNAGVGFHDGFLDDPDTPASAAHPPRYRDEPEK